VNRRLQTNGRTIVAQNWDGGRDTTMTSSVSRHRRAVDRDHRRLAPPDRAAHQNRLISPTIPARCARSRRSSAAPACSRRGCAGDRSREALTGDVVPRGAWAS
jgi:hypothetical protein